MLNCISASSLVFHAIPYAYDADDADVATMAHATMAHATYDADGATFVAHVAHLASLESFLAYDALMASNESAANNAAREGGDN